MDWSAIIGGIVGGVIGVAGGVSATLIGNANARRMALDAWRKQAYVDMMLAVHQASSDIQSVARVVAHRQKYAIVCSTRGHKG